jgi:hypothetical protein
MVRLQHEERRREGELLFRWFCLLLIPSIVAADFPGGAGFLFIPDVRCPLQMCGYSTLAGNGFPLLRGNGGKPSPGDWRERIVSCQFIIELSNTGRRDAYLLRELGKGNRGVWLGMLELLQEVKDAVFC